MNGVWLGPMEQYGPRSANDISYSGSFVFWRDGKNWEIALKSGSNTALTFLKKPGKVDVFVVDGGGNGRTGGRTWDLSDNIAFGGQGGDGGKCKTYSGVKLASICSVTVGASASESSLVSGETTYNASSGTAVVGGSGAMATYYRPQDGVNGSAGSYAFSEDRDTLHFSAADLVNRIFGSSGAGGGAATYFGGNDNSFADPGDEAVSGIGGKGEPNEGAATEGAANTGTGGGGGYGSYTPSAGTSSGGTPKAGGSGIIIIRNHHN